MQDMRRSWESRFGCDFGNRVPSIEIEGRVRHMQYRVNSRLQKPQEKTKQKTARGRRESMSGDKERSSSDVGVQMLN
jgi:hypothetical protein